MIKAAKDEKSVRLREAQSCVCDNGRIRAESRSPSSSSSEGKERKDRVLEHSQFARRLSAWTLLSEQRLAGARGGLKVIHSIRKKPKSKEKNQETVRKSLDISAKGSYLVDPASSHMLVSKIKPCMSKYKHYTVKLQMAHYISYNSFEDQMTTWIPVVILELIHAKSPDS